MRQPPSPPTARRVAVLGLLGTQLDAGTSPRRWERWRPTVSLAQHDEVDLARLDLLAPNDRSQLAQTVADDVRSLSPHTEVRIHRFDVADPWDFEEMWTALHDVVAAHPFDEALEHWVHLTTGTHVAQIGWFLLVEAGFIPAKLVQTGPPPPGSDTPRLHLVDLDLARYDRIAARYAARKATAEGLLKQGIATLDPAYNALIDQIEQVVVASDAPVLLEGPTGAGKSALARRIYELRRARRLVKGPLVEVNCATLRGDTAMSTLFGHARGAYTGADVSRDGLLRSADGGVLFLDEIGELGLDEQAMLLRAVEDRRFRPLGSDREAHSSFQLLAGTNRSLVARVAEGRFREDLLARLDRWTFRLPGLAERPADVAPNVDHELERATQRSGRRVRFNSEARERFLRWGTSERAVWRRNFRDLEAAIDRMATLSGGHRIDVPQVDAEIARLERAWASASGSGATSGSAPSRVDAILGERAAELDRFDRVQLEDVLAACAQCRSLSAAGRALFAASRERRKQVNDADRLRKYLQRFDLTWEDVHSPE